MEFIKRISFWLIITMMTVIFSVPFYWMLLIPGNKHLFFVCRLWIKIFFRLLKLFWNIDYTLEGLEHLPQDKPVIIASKHQSLLETFILFLHVPQFSFILKRELLWIPLWGWWLARLGRTIAIDRSSGVKSLHKMLNVAEKFKQKNRAIIIYPEGTRILPYQEAPLKSGVGAIYQKLQIDILPVALDAGYYFPKKGKARSGTITIKFLPAIKAGLPKKAMMEQLSTLLHQESLALLPKK